MARLNGWAKAEHSGERMDDDERKTGLELTTSRHDAMCEVKSC